MDKISISIFALFSVLILSLSNVSSSTSLHSIAHFESLVECLNKLSHPEKPIVSAIYAPDNSGFRDVLNSYVRNLRFNTSTTRGPVLILTALHESHVQAGILCAKEQGLQLKIRSGGHDYEGVSYVSDVPFFLLDMFNIRFVDVNIEEETAWIGAGATLGEVYYGIANKSSVHGYPAGTCPTVGAGGHLSGGGFGTMLRKYGLSVDNIIDAVIVDVNGRILDRATMGEDLFWAIRGGGGSNFGVIFSYKIKLVHVPEKVTVFKVSKSLENDPLTDIFLQYQEVAPNIDNNAFLQANLHVTDSSKATGAKTIIVTFWCLFLGDSHKLFSIINESFPSLGLEESQCHMMSWIESVLEYYNFPRGTPVEALLDRQPGDVPYLKRKSDYLKKPIPRNGLEGLWKKMIELETPELKFNPYGGRMAEIPSNETPFPHRAGNLFKLQYFTNWNEPGRDDYYINLTRELFKYMTPYVSKYPRQAFLNYRDLDLGINHHDKWSYLEARRYGIKYYMSNFNRLVKIKTKVDPLNFFRDVQSIPVLPRLEKYRSWTMRNFFCIIFNC